MDGKIPPKEVIGINPDASPYPDNKEKGAGASSHQIPDSKKYLDGSTSSFDSGFEEQSIHSRKVSLSLDSSHSSTASYNSHGSLSEDLPIIPYPPGSLEIGSEVGSGGFSSVARLSIGSRPTGLVIKLPLNTDDDDDEGVMPDWLQEVTKEQPLSPAPIDFFENETTESPVTFDKELVVYKRLGSHPNIVKCYGEHSVQDKQGLIMEEVNGPSLDSVVGDLTKTYLPVSESNPESFTPAVEYWGSLQELAAQTFEGVCHMNNCGLVHCDLKFDNLMLHSEESGEECSPSHQIKLIDLGLSAEEGESAAVGHELFAAPEAVLKKIRREDVEISPKLDSFSLGAMLYNTFTTACSLGESFESRAGGYVKAFKKAGGHFGDAPVPDKPVEAEPLVTSEMLEAAMKSPMLNKKVLKTIESLGDLINQLTHWDPEQRLSVQEAVNHPFFQTRLLDQNQFDRVMAELPDRKEQAVTRTVEEFQKDRPDYTVRPKTGDEKTD